MGVGVMRLRIASRACSGVSTPRTTARQTDMMSSWLFTIIRRNSARGLLQKPSQGRNLFGDVLPRAVLRDQLFDLVLEALPGAVNEIRDVRHLSVQFLGDLLVGMPLQVQPEGLDRGVQLEA